MPAAAFCPVDAISAIATSSDLETLELAADWCRRRAVEAAGVARYLPRGRAGIFNSTGVASGEVSDDPHVFCIPGWDAEGVRKLPHYRVAVVEIGADYQMYLVKLASDQSSVVTPFGQAV